MQKMRVICYRITFLLSIVYLTKEEDHKVLCNDGLYLLLSLINDNKRGKIPLNKVVKGVLFVIIISSMPQSNHSL